MNTLRNSVAIAALAIVVGYSFQARADILVMATDGVNTGTADDHATPGHTSYSGAIGNFTISYDLGAGFPGVGSPSNPVLDLTSLDLTTGTAGGTLTVSVTETDFTTTTGPMQFLSSLVGNYVNSQATLSTYFDTTNAHFGTGTLLSSGAERAGFAGRAACREKVDYTVAMALAGEPTAPGRRNGGAVNRKRERPCARSQLASSDKYQISPR